MILQPKQIKLQKKIDKIERQ